MTKKETALIKEIVNLYSAFVKETSELIDDVKKATAMSLQKTLKLRKGEIILINDDGSLEVETKEPNTRRKLMIKEEKEKEDKLLLNGREVTAEELQRQRESIKNQKGARLEEVSKGNFRLRLHG